jgi:hypothetical protein
LRSASADLHEHFCEQIGVTFITALNTCPVCDERLDVAPGFPSAVALYLKRTRSANKANVTFDYETETFVPVEDGEFVVVTSGEQAFVLPRASRFAARRDFYEYYQDYYHCPNPDAGEVHIVQPATVTRAANGWKLEATGVLEVVLDQLQKKIVPAVMREEVVAPKAPEATSPIAPEPRPTPLVAETRPAPIVPETRPAPVAPDTRPPAIVAAETRNETPCSECGALVESRYAFCWKCGHALTAESKSSRGNTPPRGSLLASAMALDDDELTVQHEMRPANTSAFPWTATKQTEHPSQSRGSVLKLMAIGGVAFLLVSLGLFGLTRSGNTEVASVAPPPQQQQVAATTPAATEMTPQPALQKQVVNEAATEPSPSVNPEDELLARLRERRLTATTDERPKIFEAFAKIERKYPRDYRFPYERAKLAAKGSLSGSRDAAFKALSAAAERAISAGKANEMLTGLETDKTGDFHRLSQGRQEWTRLVAALKRKDTSLLLVRTQFNN